MSTRKSEIQRLRNIIVQKLHEARGLEVIEIATMLRDLADETEGLPPCGAREN